MPQLGPQVIEYLKGYALANEFLEAERMERLARMTSEESAAIYDGLCELWYQSGRKAGGNLAALDELQLEAHLVQRHAFERYARARSLV